MYMYMYMCGKMSVHIHHPCNIHISKNILVCKETARKSNCSLVRTPVPICSVFLELLCWIHMISMVGLLKSQKLGAYFILMIILSWWTPKHFWFRMTKRGGQQPWVSSGFPGSTNPQKWLLLDNFQCIQLCPYYI